MSSKSGFWKSLVSVGKTALSHVNLSFDGANRTFHIDIAPIAPQVLIGSTQDAVPARLPAQVAAPEAAPAAPVTPADANQ